MGVHFVKLVGAAKVGRKTRDTNHHCRKLSYRSERCLHTTRALILFPDNTIGIVLREMLAVVEIQQQ